MDFTMSIRNPITTCTMDFVFLFFFVCLSGRWYQRHGSAIKTKKGLVATRGPCRFTYMLMYTYIYLHQLLFRFRVCIYDIYVYCTIDIYVYVYISVHQHIKHAIQLQVYIYIYIYTNTHTKVHACRYTFIHTHIQTRIHLKYTFDYFMCDVVRDNVVTQMVSPLDTTREKKFYMYI